VVIEGIISRELHGGFVAMFGCPACDRVAVCNPESKAWAE
jgi:hypothetical protein